MLIGLAQRDQLELAYGRAAIHWPDGGTEEIGRFPPVQCQLAPQMAVYHAGLASIFELELTDAAFATPSDWGFFRRMELSRTAARAGLELERGFLLHDPFEIHGSPEVVHHRGFLYGRRAE